MDKPAGAPHCFYDWESDDAQCQGGTSTHINPRTNTTQWDRCTWEAQCRQATWRLRPERIPPSLIPTTSLVRTPAPPQPAARAAAAPVYQQQAAPLAVAPPQAQAVAHPAAQVVMMHQQPVNYNASMPVNYQMPGYLSAPQDVATDGFGAALGKTLLRAAVKGIGHSLAHFFDQTPIPTGKRRE